MDRFIGHYGWLGEIAGLQASLTAAEQKLEAMRQLANRHPTTHLGMPDFRPVAGRASSDLNNDTPTSITTQRSPDFAESNKPPGTK